jgi:hypothetical protein
VTVFYMWLYVLLCGCITVVLFLLLCYVFFVSLSILIDMYVPFCVIVFFCVLFVCVNVHWLFVVCFIPCNCYVCTVLSILCLCVNVYYCHRVPAQLQLNNNNNNNNNMHPQLSRNIAKFVRGITLF